MKLALGLLLAGLLPSAAWLQQQEQEKQQEPEEKRGNAMARFFQAETERLEKELEGAWILLDYTDPSVPLGAGQTTGFVTFHEGFMTWLLAVDTAEDTLFGYRAFLALESGAYRYRIDESANLQLAAMMAFTNNTSDGSVSRDSTGAFEYAARVDRDVLELRETSGLVITFRRVEAGEFPSRAARSIEKQRSGTPAWEKNEER